MANRLVLTAVSGHLSVHLITAADTAVLKSANHSYVDGIQSITELFKVLFQRFNDGRFPGQERTVEIPTKTSEICEDICL
jgi:hypothetical protein